MSALLIVKPDNTIGILTLLDNTISIDEHIKRHSELDFFKNHKLLNIPIPPLDSEYFDSYIYDGTNVVIDLEKAKEFRKNQLRIIREDYFKKLDAEFMKTLESSDTKRKKLIVDYKNQLRDITISPAFDSATSLNDIKKIDIPQEIKDFK